MALPKNSKLDGRFVLTVALDNIHVPRMWVEKDNDSDTNVRALLAASLPMLYLRHTDSEIQSIDFDVDALCMTGVHADVLPGAGRQRRR